jgi:hypothetical protein
MFALAFSMLAAVTAAELDSEAYAPRPIAGHAVFDLRIGVDSVDGKHPYLCGEVLPLKWLSVEGCGTGSGILHHGDEPDLAHFRSRIRALHLDAARVTGDLLVGVGFAELQRTTDKPGFKFGKAKEDAPVEAAGAELSLSTKARVWLDDGGRTYATADLNAGAAYIPGAPAVMGGTTKPLVPFAAITAGIGF